MAIFRPFYGIRPVKDKASLVAALPYDVMNSAEAYEMAKDNPYSFLHVDRAEIDLPAGTDIYSGEVYEKAASNLRGMIENGTFIKDKSKCFYVYRLIMDGRSQTGLVGCASIDDYMNSVIKKHELTREDKERDRINHVKACNANTGPIFLTYRHRTSVNEMIEGVKKNEPEYDFTADDGIRHTVWIIDDEDLIYRLCYELWKVNSFYIADGHHRSASAVKVGIAKREEAGQYDGNEEFNYFLSVLFPDNELKILDYNRVVADLNGLSVKDFLAKAGEAFEIAPSEGAYRPEDTHEFGMYLEGKWYSLKAKPEVLKDKDTVGLLDVSVLYDNILAPVLGIGDPRTDKRIDFVGGIRGLKELERLVDGGCAVAFAMYPTQVEELMSIADRGLLMPPKSTWFEPKLRSGLFIHELD